MDASTNSNGNEIQHYDSVIEARSLVLSRGGAPVVHVDHLDIGAGVTALVGPNGSGKSTLLHACAGLIEPTRGTIGVLAAPPDAVRRRVAYVLQEQHAPANLPVTVGEIVRLGRSAQRGAFGRLRRTDHDAVRRAIERVGLGRLTNRHVADLSGGERQRVYLAQGLAQDADVLLLDEPTAGLDLASCELIAAVVAGERALGRTVIVATHDLGDAARSDAVVLLAGRVVAAGSPGDVLTRANLGAAYGGRLLDLDGDLVLVDDDDSHHHLDADRSVLPNRPDPAG